MLPIGPIVVPFGDYLIGFYIRTPKRNYYMASGYAPILPGKGLGLFSVSALILVSL